MLPNAIPTPPAGADPAAPESFWGAPATDSSGLDRLVRALPPEPEPVPEPAAAVPSADAATIQRLEQAIQNLEASRYAQPAAVTADPTQLAAALVQAMNTAADQRNNAAAQAQAMERPFITIDDAEALIADPVALQNALRSMEANQAGYAENLVNYVERRMLDRLGPAVQRAEAIGRVAAPILTREMQRAEVEGQAIAARSGIPEARYKELLPHARKIIEDANNLSPEQKVQMRMDPQTMALAVQNVLYTTGGGVPISQVSPGPPSAPLPSSGAVTAPPAKSDSKRLVENLLGKPLDWSRLERDMSHKIDKRAEVA